MSRLMIRDGRSMQDMKSPLVPDLKERNALGPDQGIRNCCLMIEDGGSMQDTNPPLVPG